MDAWIIWLIIAAFLITVEIMTQTMWALCLSAGALGAMACALCGLGIGWQTAAMAALSAAACLVILPMFRRRHTAAESRTGMDALLGRRATVTHAIHPGHLGRARIDGDSWQVKAPSAEGTIPAGTEVVVTSYDSIILTVAIPS